MTVSSSVLKQMEDIKEETGLTCCICREGYRYQPQKVITVLRRRQVLHVVYVERVIDTSHKR